jgi:hypothetical protein
VVDTKINEVDAGRDVVFDPVDLIEMSIGGTEVVNFYLRVVFLALGDQHSEIVFLGAHGCGLDPSLALPRPLELQNPSSVFFAFSHH